MPAELNTYYVPWPDISEWNVVKQQIFSSDIRDTIRAYETILMWKLKYDGVPAYVESTYSLLQVMVKEYEITKAKSSSSLYLEHDLQLSYSTALIRFVNHVSSINSYKGETLYLAAKALNIPDWIINMRHDAAHGQDLPTLDALHVAAQISLKWLLDNYWSNSGNFVEKTQCSLLSRLEPSSNFEMDFNVGNIFKKAFYVWELCSDKKGKHVIGDMKQEFFLHLEEMLSLNNNCLCNLNNASVGNLQNIIEVRDKFSKNKMSTINLKEFRKVMLNFFKNTIEGNAQAKYCLVLSLLETTFLSVTHFEPLKWKEILWLLQEKKLFTMLVEILFEMAGKGHKGASNWLSALLPSIKLLKKQWATFKILAKENKNYKTNLLRKKVERRFDSKKRGLPISLKIFKPPVISFEMMKEVLLNPEFLGVQIIVQYLKLVRPPLPKSAIHLIKNLASLQAEEAEGKADRDLGNEKIYTVEDVSMKNVDVAYEEATVNENGWTKSSIGVEVWGKCPLGLLPFQIKVDCSLPDELRWKTNSSPAKRASIPLLEHFVNIKKTRSV